MSNTPGFEIAIDLSPVLIGLAVVLLAAYAYFSYRYTVPLISTGIKVLLITIRSIILILIMLLIFEPSIVFNSEQNYKPVNYIFVDNSSSMVSRDSASTADKVKAITSGLEGSLQDESKIFLFGKNTSEESGDYVSSITFDRDFTNLESVISRIDSSEENVTNVIMLTDGIFNTGKIPLDKIESMGIPFNIVAVGDTTIRPDVTVKSITTNNYIYADKETIIESVILNNSLGNETVKVDLLENGKVIGSKNVKLSESGINRVNFTYTPEKAGEVKLSVRSSTLPGEESAANNLKTEYRKILESKIQIGLISDSPSPDITFIKEAIERDKNYEVEPVVAVNQSKTINESESKNKIDSLDILVLTGYPGKNTNRELFNNVNNLISEKNIPFFIVMSPATDLSKLSAVKNKLPFNIPGGSVSFSKAQMNVTDNLNALLQVNSKYSPEDWTSLPPVPAVSSDINPRVESEVVATSKIKNIDTGIPFLLTRSSGNSRSVALLAHDIWRWKLQSKNQEVFDQFIANIIRWLTVDPDADRFKVTTDKKIYASGENIIFSAELFDEKLSPILDSEIKVTLTSESGKTDLFLSLNELGIYTGSTTLQSTGDVTYNAQASLDNKAAAEASGKITITPTNLEKLNSLMDLELLSTITNLSSGELVNPDNINKLIETVNQSNRGKTKTELSREVHKLWSDKITLILLIILFSIEWFIRKRLGMV